MLRDNFCIAISFILLQFVFIEKGVAQSGSNSACLNTFQLTLSSTDAQTAYDVADAGNGNFFIAGLQYNSTTQNDILITKNKADGSIIWSKSYASFSDESVRRIKATSDGGLLIAGQTKSFDNFSGEILVFKIDLNGQLLWSQKFGVGSPYGDLALDIIETSDGGFAFTGLFNANGSVADLTVIKLDNTGSISWSKRFNSSQAEDGSGILQNGNELIVTSDLDNNGGQYHFVLLRLNLSDGSLIDTKKYTPSERGLFLPTIYKDVNGNGFWISGHTIDFNSYSQMQQTFLKLDNNFDITKTYQLAVSPYTNYYYTGFAPMTDGFITCASPQTDPDGYFFYIKDDGTVKMSKKFTGTADRSLYRLAHIGSKIIAAGADNTSGNNDFFVAGFGDDGFIDAECHPDTAQVTVTNPSFSTSAFSWTSIADQSFSNTAAPLTVNDIVLTTTSTCDPCLPDVTAGFIAPDTVCVNTQVQVTDTSSNATNYYWSFCAADFNNNPEAVNIGNPGGLLNVPVFMDLVQDNSGNYFTFSTNHLTGEIIRNSYGNSFLNTPTAYNLGNFGGITPAESEGIQVVQANGKWYAIIVGGGNEIANSQPRIVKIDFGNSLSNNSPTATNWGNIGSLSFPHELVIVSANNQYYGFATDAFSNSIVRFNFGNGFDNPPTGTNLGNIGNLNYPAGINILEYNSQWYAFVTNRLSNSITRLSFGSSLLNTPSASSIGNPGNLLSKPRDISLLAVCNGIYGFVVNEGTNAITKLNFGFDLNSNPQATDIGNVGNLNFPHSITELFVTGNDIYAFIPNATGNSITRLRFAGCSDIPASTLQNPPPVIYKQAGTYNINLLVDVGLPTQQSVCKTITVIAPPPEVPVLDTSFCTGDSIVLNANYPYGAYTWSNGSNADSIKVKTAGTFWVDYSYYGCTGRDSFTTSLNPLPIVNLGKDTSICPYDSLIINAGSFSNYLWQDSSVKQTYLAKKAGTYSVKVTDNNGCRNKDTIVISNLQLPVFTLTNDTAICKGSGITLNAKGNNISGYEWSPGGTLSSTTISNPVATPVDTTTYTVKVTSTNTCYAFDSVTVNVVPPPAVKTRGDTSICKGTSVILASSAAGADMYSWSPRTGLNDSTLLSPAASPAATATYIISASNKYCAPAKDTVVITVLPLPAVNLGKDTSICPYDSLIINAGSFSNYLWQDGATTQTYTAKKAAVYFVTVTDNNGCSNKDSITISNLKLPSFTLTGDTTICAGSSITLQVTGNNIAAYQWSPAQTLSSTTISNPVATPLDTTEYFVTVTSTNTCYAADSVTVNIAQPPTVKTINDTSACKGTAVQLLSAAGNANKYSWSPKNGLSNSNLLSPLATPDDTTTYIISASNAYCNPAFDTVTVNVLPLPLASAGNDTTICGAASAQLQASGGIAYKWSPAVGLSDTNIPNPVATPGATTNYSVLVTGTNGCTASDAVLITVNPVPAFSVNPANASLCLGDSVLLIASGGDTYQWLQPDSVLSPNSPVTFVVPSGNFTYQVAITNIACKTTDTLSATVSIRPQPDASVTKSNDVNCVIGIATLTATGGIQYRWSPVYTLSNPYISKPVATPTTTTTYYVRITAANGCALTDSITVNVIKGAAEDGYKLPNAFTPNGDGINDCFGVKKWGAISKIDFSVYNRWGNMVFHTSNPSECWYGTYRGDTQPSGTYVYQIRATTICGDVYRKGTVILIR